ncbi:MAG TPA: response regulator transcription factor [Pyrinomonadaceae bacterium]|nr:response regulator transcription factor [Pyrinomonadaceae bacterium]
MNTLRIVLADDHVMLRDGLKSLVNAQPDMEVVGEADDGRAAVDRAQELRPDVVVMDISMPQLNGIQATEQLKGRSRGTKVLVLTAYDEVGYLRQLLEAGASGYVLKKAAAEDLVKAIRVVASGGVYLDPTLAGKLVGGYVGRKKLRGALQGVELSGREEEVLRLVAWGYTNKEVAGYLNISVKTVETHKTNLMEKLDLGGRSDIVRYALRRGWLSEA